MKWLINASAALLAVAGVSMLGPAAYAQGAGSTIDNGGCELFPNEGLGQETCAPPNPFPGEGVLFTAAEQVVSIASAVADDVGCPAVSFGGPVAVTITPHFSLPQRATTGVGAATFLTTEVANTQHTSTGSFQHNGVRRHEVALVASGVVFSSLFGNGLTELAGTFDTDGQYSIMHGSSAFRHSGVPFEERVIKDFYAGVARPPTFVAAADPNGPLVACTEAQFNLGQCVVKDAGDFSPSSPFVVPRILRNNGLEVTKKSQLVPNLAVPASPPVLLIGHPKGKWRQTSFYRGPNGGKGHLTYTKVRIAPFGSPSCALQLDGDVTGSISFPVFAGTLVVFPLG